MKLLLLMILLCGINVSPTYTVQSVKRSVSHKKETARIKEVAQVKEADCFEMVPSGLVFQF